MTEMILKCVATLLILLALPASSVAALLPGFELIRIAEAEGFPTSITFAPNGDLFYSSATGEIYRLEGATSRLVAKVDTASEGNAALLGIIFRGENEILTHHVSSDLTADVIASVDVASGISTRVAVLPCNDGRACSSEHHGGNLAAGPGGTIFFGIGDFGGGAVAQLSESPGGKIFSIAPTNEITQFARGFRNVFDVAFDAASGNLIVPDNGPIADDEISFVKMGDNAGWPLTVGSRPPVEGMLPPAYIFEGTVAPTGTLLLSGRGNLKSGLLVGGFVTSTIYFFPDIRKLGEPPPFQLVPPEVGHVIDVAQHPDGRLFFATTSVIYELATPIPGDADGNGRVDAADFGALSREILDGDGSDTFSAQGGSFPGSWGADVNGDGSIDARDLLALARLGQSRKRPVRPTGSQ